MEIGPLFFLQIIGGLCLFRFLYTQWRIFYVHFFPREFDFKGVAGDGYALITGGAEGIGKQCALHFAEKGINLMLVDFNEKKLKETTKEITEKVCFLTLAC
jgi:17beta-estradiol 17-dehydrogenase / very-long-chain 3-oxoacyl-CoA reductase